MESRKDEGRHGSHAFVVQKYAPKGCWHGRERERLLGFPSSFYQYFRYDQHGRVIQEIAEVNYVMKSRRPGENYLVLRALLLRKPVDEANDEANDEIHMPFIVTPDWEKSVADITHW